MNRRRSNFRPPCRGHLVRGPNPANVWRLRHIFRLLRAAVVRVVRRRRFRDRFAILRFGLRVKLLGQVGARFGAGELLVGLVRDLERQLERRLSQNDLSSLSTLSGSGVSSYEACLHHRFAGGCFVGDGGTGVLRLFARQRWCSR